MPWLSITLDLNGMRAEAVSEALVEAGALSVSMEDALAGGAGEDAQFDEPDTSPPRPWRRTRLVALAEAGADAAALVGRAARDCGIEAPLFQVSRVEDDDWVRRTQAQFSPIRCGERIWIVPSWHQAPDPGALNIRLDPGLAFGTGSHPTTRLVLAWLERELCDAEVDPPRVLDYGCGSGILALAAALLGAREVAATDLDPQALEATRTSARANGVALQITAPDALRSGTFDIVVANILANPLFALEPILAGRTRPGGRLALSGILAAQADDVLAAYAGDFDCAVGASEEGWVLVEGRRKEAFA
ncbi:MAG: 50S ribosomal protein L11 methyltransferase [Betaproteobacteria bacterium]|nr:50S ribosomal protein L11 methyltransferase [Betaproteobacteria bacterium]